ncbi:MAG: tetratricopeptide repeat protein [Spirochaetaceae bacterium]|nr:MAG: tetratricopeptide repeat protein [Spirochaetaceae bacterium]
MAARTSRKTGGSKSSRGNGKTVSSGTLIASIIAAFLVGYVVSAFVGGFRLDAGIGGGSQRSGGRQPGGWQSGDSTGQLFQQAPSRNEYIESLKQRASQNPNDREIWTELGNAYFDSDQYPEAIDAYQRSLDIDPENANVWTDIGIMYRRTGDFSQAIEAFDRAMAEDPSHEQSRFNKGIVLYYDLGDRIGAFQSWDELAKINPNFRTPGGRTILQMMGDLR